MGRKFIKFILVGILNTLFGYGVYAFFIFVGVHYSLAVLLAAIIGALFNFKTIGRLVFKSHDNALIFRFLTVYVVTYFLNVAGLRVCDMLRVDMYLAGILRAGPVAVVAFCLHNWFVFREPAVSSQLRRGNCKE